jgi:hypothetical protein
MRGTRTVQHENFWLMPQGIGKQKLIGLITEELRFSYGCSKMEIRVWVILKTNT